MKCPNCGEEMADDHLICEHCGWELQMVPDFEPELENSMTETLSTLAALQEDQTDEPADDTDVETIENTRNNDKKRIGIIIPVAAFLVICCAIFFAAYRYYVYQTGTYAYQLNKANSAASAGDYEQAIHWLDAAYAIDASDADILFRKADYEYLLEDISGALDTLSLIISSDRYSQEDVEDAYDEMVTIYDREGQYEEISNLLLACTDNDIITRYQSYLAMAPDFSYPEGSYGESIALKLSSNTAGTIYYTLDGTIPGTDSLVYTAPLFLEEGENTVSAYFVNDYGIGSEVVQKTYVIDIVAPNPPEVSLYSGEYTAPAMIEATAESGVSVYYTTDGSTPTQESTLYSGPIPMPLGFSRFQFAAISSEGVTSTIVSRSYTLHIDGAMDTDEALADLLLVLVDTGYLTDVSGTTANENIVYQYRFSYALQVGENVEYVFDEYFQDAEGALTRTDRQYLVQAYIGTVAAPGYDETGEVMAEPIGGDNEQ